MWYQILFGSPLITPRALRDEGSRFELAPPLSLRRRNEVNVPSGSVRTYELTVEATWRCTGVVGVKLFGRYVATRPGGTMPSSKLGVCVLGHMWVFKFNELYIVSTANGNTPGLGCDRANSQTLSPIHVAPILKGFLRRNQLQSITPHKVRHRNNPGYPRDT